MKSEVTDYSIDDMKRDHRADWVGVRNYQARNFMRDSMSDGDLAFFYHSNAEPSGIAGIVRIRGAAKPDLTQFDKKSKYYDEKAKKDEPRWMLREVEFVKKISKIISLNDLRELSECKKMAVLQKGSRLSITPVTKQEWDGILKKKGLSI